MKFSKKIYKSEILEEYRKENNPSKQQFCKLCKISTNTYKKILNNENVIITSLFRIARVLNIHVCEMFE